MANSRRYAAALLALAIMASTFAATGLGRAYAYLTSRAETSGYAYLDTGTPRTSLGDEVANWEKKVTVTNTGTSDCRVRAKILVPEKYLDYISYTQTGSGWRLDADGYWYYDKDLAPGASTTVLSAKIDSERFTKDFTKDGALDFNVVVVHEYARVQANGTVDWSETVTLK